VGSQNRSVIFYHDKEQRQIAQQVKSELDASGKYRYPIVTQIVPAEDFFKAEEYHQRYYAKNRPWRF
jgi:peptide-methionine (S)-S-oxide reductase